MSMTVLGIFIFLTFAIFVAFVVLVRKAYRDFVFDRRKRWLVLAIVVMILCFEMLHFANIVMNISVGISLMIVWLVGAGCLVKCIFFASGQFKFAEPIIDGLFQVNQHIDIAKKMQTEFLHFGSRVSWFESTSSLADYRESFILFTKCDLNNINQNNPCVNELLAIQKKFRTQEFVSFFLLGVILAFVIGIITFVVGASFIAL